MARYIIREGTVRGQGRYWCGKWSDTDKFIYMDREQPSKAAIHLGGRVVCLTTKAEHEARKERAAVVRWLREHHWSYYGAADAIERGDHRKGE